jgi:ABC-type cobalamin transport system ATPase subunit
MVQQMRAIGLLILCGYGLSSCFSIADVNTAYRRLDRVWQLEYQKTEAELRQRVVAADIATAFNAIRLTFIELNLPVQTG